MLYKILIDLYYSFVNLIILINKASIKYMNEYNGVDSKSIDYNDIDSYNDLDSYTDDDSNNLDSKVINDNDLYSYTDDDDSTHLDSDNYNDSPFYDELSD